jgi:DNA replication licensing factor MCM2
LKTSILKAYFYREDQEDEIEEAEEAKNEVLEEEEKGESEGSGEELMEKMKEDYEAIPELDKYEANPVDEEKVEPMTLNERRAADRDLNERDKTEMKNWKRNPAAMDEEMEDDLEEAAKRREFRLRQKERARTAENEPYADETINYLDIEDLKGKTSDWIKQGRTVNWIKTNFSKFLREFRLDANTCVYEQRITEMCTNNKQSLEVTYGHLTQKSPTLALWLAEHPATIIPILNEEATYIVNELFPSYANIHSEIYVKIKDLPIEDKLRELRQTNLKGLVKVKGVITKSTGVFPQLKQANFICKKCGCRKGPFFMSSTEKLNLGTCLTCQSKNSFGLDDEKSVYRNYQKITIQETPGTVPAGRVPRQKDVILLDDNIDIARPGDEVEITGIYNHYYDIGMNMKHGFPVFNTTIEANYVRRLEEMEITELTEQDKKQIIDLSKDPNIGSRIMASIAPSIFGHEFVKTALALAMFGGMPKDVGGKHRIRGDINVLLLGDPGTAKSQFMKYVENAVHRAVYTTGKGASAVGLTAGVRKDPMTKEWTLEGGALVLADKGICLIDEFDKMNDKDRTSIHEAMEQQSISISKAGIVTSLQVCFSILPKNRHDAA